MSDERTRLIGKLRPDGTASVYEICGDNLLKTAETVDVDNPWKTEIHEGEYVNLVWREPRDDKPGGWEIA